MELRRAVVVVAAVLLLLLVIEFASCVASCPESLDDFPSELARLDTILERTACPVALKLEARSAITAALQQTTPAYGELGALSMPSSMQGISSAPSRGAPRATRQERSGGRRTHCDRGRTGDSPGSYPPRGNPHAPRDSDRGGGESRGRAVAHDFGERKDGEISRVVRGAVKKNAIVQRREAAGRPGS